MPLLSAKAVVEGLGAILVKAGARIQDFFAHSEEGGKYYIHYQPRRLKVEKIAYSVKNEAS